MRGQELERHIGGGEAVAVGGAEVGRAAAPVAHDLADDDVGAVLARGGVHALERVGLQPVVVVGEEHELALRGVQADVARAPGQPEFGMCSTRTPVCRAARASRRSPVPSQSRHRRTEPRSPAGMVWPSSDTIRGSIRSPGSNTGMTTLTFVTEDPCSPRSLNGA